MERSASSADVLLIRFVMVSAALFEALIAGETYGAVRLAGDVSAATGYGGEWVFGVGVTHAGGASSWIKTQNFFDGDAAAYPDESYEQFARASVVEIQDAPGSVTRRLVGRLLRSLGTDEHPDIAAFIGGDVPTT